MKRLFKFLAIVGFVVGFALMVALPGYKEVSQEVKNEILLVVWVAAFVFLALGFFLPKPKEE